MANALATMRVDYDQLQIKKLGESKNKLLEKRKKKMGNEPVIKEEKMHIDGESDSVKMWWYCRSTLDHKKLTCCCLMLASVQIV